MTEKAFAFVLALAGEICIAAVIFILAFSWGEVVGGRKEAINTTASQFLIKDCERELTRLQTIITYTVDEKLCDPRF